jgi:hypothetical protein
VFERRADSAILVRQTLKTIATYAEQACALQWRVQLVRFLHAMYLKDRTAYTLIMGLGSKAAVHQCQHCLLLDSSLHGAFPFGVAGGQGGSGGKRFENPDQRITQDAERYTTQLAHLLRLTIVVPGLIGYCTFAGSKFARHLMFAVAPHQLVVCNSQTPGCCGTCLAGLGQLVAFCTFSSARS